MLHVKGLGTYLLAQRNPIDWGWILKCAKGGLCTFISFDIVKGKLEHRGYRCESDTGKSMILSPIKSKVSLPDIPPRVLILFL